MKPILLATLIAAWAPACSAGNSTPAVPSPGSALSHSESLGLALSPSQTTGSDIIVRLQTVNLRSAANFAVLAGSTVTSTGPTKINGGLGVSPGTAVTGFPPGIVNGNMHKGDPTSAQAEADLTTAYNDAMGRDHNPIAVAGNLGGQTLTPGLYKSTSSLAVSSGDLTLDARGDSRAVWIFQTASTFTMTTGRAIILTNGASAKHIFWAVGSSATLGTGCTFYGNILSHQAISMATGSVVTGRMLARIAAVTMESNTITKP